MVPVVPYAVLIATLVASHQCTSRSGIWLGICPPPKPPDIEIVEPGIEGTMLESFDQGFELRRYCNVDNCVLYRVYRRCVPRPLAPADIFGRGSLLSPKALRVSAHTPRASRTA